MGARVAPAASVGPAERVARIREAFARARNAVAQVQALLAATERVLSALEAMLADESVNVVPLSQALDTLGSTRRVVGESLLETTETADRALDALGAGPRLVT